MPSSISARVAVTSSIALSAPASVLTLSGQSPALYLSRGPSTNRKNSTGVS